MNRGAELAGTLVAIGTGAALGAWLRWWLGGRLNQLLPSLPMGTLAANLLGGYLVGVAVAIFASAPSLHPNARLFAITGFLGGLTTFSTFSAEVVTMMLGGQWLWAGLTTCAHLGGSLALTALGIATVRLLQ